MCKMRIVSIIYFNVKWVYFIIYFHSVASTFKEFQFEDYKMAVRVPIQIVKHFDDDDK